jgi:hypothetical protein
LAVLLMVLLLGLPVKVVLLSSSLVASVVVLLLVVVVVEVPGANVAHSEPSTGTNAAHQRRQR